MPQRRHTDTDMQAQAEAEAHLNHLRINEDAVTSLLEFRENTVQDIELTADAHAHLRAKVPLCSKAVPTYSAR